MSGSAFAGAPRKGFTLIELLLVVAIIAVLIALVLPAMGAVLRRGDHIACVNNMRNIGIALAAYTQESRGLLPPSSCPSNTGTVNDWWMVRIRDYTQADIRYRCPSDTSDRFVDWNNLPTERLEQYRWSSYSVNSRLDKPPYNNIRRVKDPRKTIYLCETPDGNVGADHVHPEMWFTEQDVRNHVATDRHDGKSNFLFLDWSVATLDVSETWKKGEINLWNPKKAPAWSSARDF